MKEKVTIRHAVSSHLRGIKELHKEMCIRDRHRANRIRSFCAEPYGGCAMTLSGCCLLYTSCNYDNGNCILLDDGDECVCRSSFPIRFSASGFGLRYFPPTGCSMRSFTRQGTGRSVPSAARSLRQALTVLNTAPSAGSVSPADKPPSA